MPTRNKTDKSCRNQDSRRSRDGRTLGAMKLAAQALHDEDSRRHHARKLKSAVEMFRTGLPTANAFEACVRIGSFKMPKRRVDLDVSDNPDLWGEEPETEPRVPMKTTSGFRETCAQGRNPREALRKALLDAAGKLKNRSGVFG